VTSAGTTRGFGEQEFRDFAYWIVEIVDGLATYGEDANDTIESSVREKVSKLCARYPIY